jgi:hypothetical protein
MIYHSEVLFASVLEDVENKCCKNEKSTGLFDEVDDDREDVVEASGVSKPGELNDDGVAECSVLNSIASTPLNRSLLEPYNVMRRQRV